MSKDALKTGGVRQRIAEDLARDYDPIASNLLEIAKGAKKQEYATCTHCNKRTPVQVRDTASIVRAAQLLIEQGYGRPAQEAATDNSMQALAKRAEQRWEIPQMADEELAALDQWRYENDPEYAARQDAEWDAFRRWHANLEQLPDPVSTFSPREMRVKFTGDRRLAGITTHPRDNPPK